MMPDVPTVGEAGVPGCEAALWTAVVVPAAVPAPIIKRLQKAVIDAVNNPQLREALKIQGVDAEPGPPEVVAARIKADIVKWRQVVADAHIVVAK
jgi:tripartite-type tricarboxylate transporter receptor subunit TctC